MKRIFSPIMLAFLLAGCAAGPIKHLPPVPFDQPYNLRLQYQFTPGFETFSTITDVFSDPAQITLHGYQYALAVETSQDEGLDWSDPGKVVMTSPAPINSRSSIASCYTGTGIDPFTGRETRYVDFYCDGGAFRPEMPPKGTYTISVPRSSGTGIRTLAFQNIAPPLIDPNVYGVLVPSVRLTRDTNGSVTMIDWTWWKSDAAGVRSPALDSEIAAARAIILEIGSINSAATVSADVSAIRTASGSVVPPVQMFTPARFSFFYFDNAWYGYVFHWQEAPRTMSLITPYLDSSDVGSIREAFSAGENAPWSFQHLGIDFFPKADLGHPMLFQAAAPGIVEEVLADQNTTKECVRTKTCKWQVHVRVRYDSAHSVECVFEPYSHLDTDKADQLAKVPVAVGDVVKAGDPLGTLHNVDPGSHVDFGIMRNNDRICPEPYFTPEARRSILDLINNLHPAWDDDVLCY